jgi:hypothetical protein
MSVRALLSDHGQFGNNPCSARKVLELYLERPWHAACQARVSLGALDWVIVRPAVLTNSPRTRVYRSGFDVADRSIQAKISRADVAADFMFLTDDVYLRKTPGVSY